MAKTVNIGVIGVGAFMARQHLPNLQSTGLTRIHTLCDLDEDLLAQRREEFDPVAVTTAAEAVFDDPRIDAVMVGTRAGEHARMIELAARSGKHVYVEKPMTMTYEQTHSVLEAVSGSGIEVGVGFNRRFAPAMVAARELFRARRTGPANVIYRIVDDHRVRPEYIFDMDDGGGHLLQEGCHIFDLLAWMLGSEPVEIFATGPIETDNVVILKFADGSLATVLCGGKGGLFYPKELLEMFAGHTTVAVDQFYELRADGPDGTLRRTFPLDPKSGGAPAEDNMTAYYEASFAQRPDRDETDIAVCNALHQLRVDKGHVQAITAFAEAIANGTPYAVNAIDGARATVCALKGYESIRTNRPVVISPTDYGLEG